MGRFLFDPRYPVRAVAVAGKAAQARTLKPRWFHRDRPALFEACLFSQVLPHSLDEFGAHLFVALELGRQEEVPHSQNAENGLTIYESIPYSIPFIMPFIGACQLETRPAKGMQPGMSKQPTTSGRRWAGSTASSDTNQMSLGANLGSLRPPLTSKNDRTYHMSIDCSYGIILEWRPPSRY